MDKEDDTAAAKARLCATRPDLTQEQLSALLNTLPVEILAGSQNLFERCNLVKIHATVGTNDT